MKLYNRHVQHIEICSAISMGMQKIMIIYIYIIIYIYKSIYYYIDYIYPGVVLCGCSTNYNTTSKTRDARYLRYGKRTWHNERNRPTSTARKIWRGREREREIELRERGLNWVDVRTVHSVYLSWVILLSDLLMRRRDHYYSEHRHSQSGCTNSAYNVRSLSLARWFSSTLLQVQWSQ